MLSDKNEVPYYKTNTHLHPCKVKGVSTSLFLSLEVLSGCATLLISGETKQNLYSFTDTSNHGWVFLKLFLWRVEACYQDHYRVLLWMTCIMLDASCLLTSKVALSDLIWFTTLALGENEVKGRKKKSAFKLSTT